MEHHVINSGGRSLVFFEIFISPLQRTKELDVDNLFVEVEGFDCLHDEGKQLYEKARERVTKATLLDNKGTFHAFDANYAAAVSMKTLEARCTFIGECFKKERLDSYDIYRCI